MSLRDRVVLLEYSTIHAQQEETGLRPVATQCESKRVVVSFTVKGAAMHAYSFFIAYRWSYSTSAVGMVGGGGLWRTTDFFLKRRFRRWSMAPSSSLKLITIFNLVKTISPLATNQSFYSSSLGKYWRFSCGSEQKRLPPIAFATTLLGS